MPPEEPRPGTRRAAEAIEAYLAQHPAAADSEQGIAQWWLPAMGMEVPMEVVCEALDWLVKHGVVTRTALPQGQAIYRAATP